MHYALSMWMHCNHYFSLFALSLTSVFSFASILLISIWSDEVSRVWHEVGKEDV